MSDKFDTEDPRYHERFAAAVELLRMWRNLVDEGNGVPRFVILPGAALNTVVKWTDDFLRHPATELNTPKCGNIPKP
jgi:hypothetical protein